MLNICEMCGDGFQAPPSQKARFCNRNCYDKSREGLFKCDNCGVEFKYFKSHKKGKLVFCSAKCQIDKMQGEKHPHWKGGKTLVGNGYISLFVESGKKRMREHRQVMEKHLGRKLEPNEIVHHINGNKLDNRIENLVITNRAEHASTHKENGYQKGHKQFNTGRTWFKNKHVLN